MAFFSGRTLHICCKNAINLFGWNDTFSFGWKAFDDYDTIGLRHFGMGSQFDNNDDILVDDQNQSS